MTFLRRTPLIAALLFVSLIPGLALAHAQLQATNPADGAIVEAMPDAVTLTFTEEISPLALRWVAPDGVMTEAAGEARGKLLSVAPPTEAQRGTYTLSWRIVSGDGHPVGGALTFHLGAASGARALIEESSAAVETAVLRFLLSLALVSAVGVSLFSAFVSRAEPGPVLRRYGRIVAGAALPLAALFLGFHGLDLTALAPADLLTPTPWIAAITSPVAWTASLSALAALVAGFGLSRAPVLALAAWGLAAASYAASGHAVTAPPRALSTAAVIVHAAAMIWWIGALVPLLLSLRAPGALIRMQRFSTVAIGMVIALIVSGVALIKVQAGDLEALFGSDYGKVLGIKLALVAALLGLAALNRLRLTPALAQGNTRGLARSIRAEIILAIVILALAATFRLTPPPRALMAQAEPAYVHIHGATAMADVTIDPAQTGPVTTSIALQTGDFSPLSPKAVDIAFAPANGALEPIRRSATLGDDELWHVDDVTLPVPGPWEITLRILITDFESALLTGVVEIAK